MPEAKTQKHTVNVSPEITTELLGKKIPCFLCGQELTIYLSKRNKPYMVCDNCSMQIFVRGKAGIVTLFNLLNSELNI